MIRFIFAFIMLLGGPGWSAPIVVKSGDHGNFTRLVVYLEKGQTWSASQDGDIVTLQVEDWSQGFDISSVFRRINNERLKSLTASDGTLVLGLECQCEFTATELQQGFVSIDIRQSEQRRPQPNPQRQVPTPDQEPETEDTAEPETPPSLPVIIERPDDFAQLGRIIENNQKSAAADFEAGLTSEISRSATLTYLAPNDALLDRDEEIGSQTGPRTQDELLEILSERARFSNAQDGKLPKRSKPEASCPAPDGLAVSLWGGDLEFPDQMAHLRESLYSEFDALDPRAVRNLARFYVHYALSPELQQFLETFEVAGVSADLSELAAVISDSVNSTDVFDQFIHCEGEGRFWAFLSNPAQIEISQNDVEGFVATFQRFPRHLQHLVADRLIRILDQKEYKTASGVLRSALTLQPEYDGDDAGAITLSSDLKGLGQVELFELIERNDEKSPDALLAYVKNANRDELALPSETLELVSSFIHQLEGEEIAKSLRSEKILATMFAGNSSTAIAELFSAGDAKLENPKQLRNELMSISLAQPDLPRVSELVWKYSQRGQIGDLPLGLRAQVAEFLIDNGQPQLVELILNDPTVAEDSPLVGASTFAQNGRLQEAITLVGNSREENIGSGLSVAILGEDPQFAWENRNRLSEEAFQAAAWVSQQWTEVEGETPRARVADLVIEDREFSNDPSRPIKTAQDARTKSQEVRNALSELIN